MVSPDLINQMMAEHWTAARTRCTDLGSDFAVATLDCVESDLRPGGYISGPVQFAAADAALWFLCHGAIGKVEPLALTSDLSIRYLRPAQGERLVARAELNKLGGRTLVGSVTITVDESDEPVAIAQGTYVLPNPGPP